MERSLINQFIASDKMFMEIGLSTLARIKSRSIYSQFKMFAPTISLMASKSLIKNINFNSRSRMLSRSKLKTIIKQLLLFVRVNLNVIEAKL